MHHRLGCQCLPRLAVKAPQYPPSRCHAPVTARWIPADPFTSLSPSPSPVSVVRSAGAALGAPRRLHRYRHVPCHTVLTVVQLRTWLPATLACAKPSRARGRGAPLLLRNAAAKPPRTSLRIVGQLRCSPARSCMHPRNHYTRARSHRATHRTHDHF